MLELTDRHEPLGFVAWDVMLSPAIALHVSPWISDDVGGRVLFHARPEQVFKGPSTIQPVRAVPLLLWLTHRSLRALYQCTPSEALAIGRRLTELAPQAVGSDEVQECSPASLFDMIWRWIEEDPLVPTMPGPNLGGEWEEEMVLPWRRPWTYEQLKSLALLRPLPALARFGPAPQRAKGPASLMTYEDDPTVLCPVRLVLENALYTPRELLDLLHEGTLRDPLVAGCHADLAAYSSFRTLTVMAPLLGDSWQQRLRDFRDRLARRTGGEAACTLVDRSEMVELCRGIRRRLREVRGSVEVYHPPFPGAPDDPPDAAGARELRYRLMNAVALPVAEDPLAELRVAEGLYA